jgi:ribosomal protein S18 acetylase RimI-like enzyme
VEASEIKIRKADAGDLATLLAFEQAVIDAERPFDPTIKTAGARYYDIEELISSTLTQILVAESDGQVIASGYARIKDSSDYLKHRRHSYLGFMYVVPEFRGRGVNRLIVDELIKWSAENKVFEIRLEVYGANTPAIRAYEKAGFRKHIIEMRLGIDEK